MQVNFGSVSAGGRRCTCRESRRRAHLGLSKDLITYSTGFRGILSAHSRRRFIEIARKGFAIDYGSAWERRVLRGNVTMADKLSRMGTGEIFAASNLILHTGGIQKVYCNESIGQCESANPRKASGVYGEMKR